MTLFYPTLTFDTCWQKLGTAADLSYKPFCVLCLGVQERGDAHRAGVLPGCGSGIGWLRRRRG